MVVPSVKESLPLIPAQSIVEVSTTQNKVAQVAKDLFKKAIFWAAVTCVVLFSLSIVKAAIMNPITAIALGVLGFVAYQNKDKMISFVKIHVAALKDKLGINQEPLLSQVKSNIFLGKLPVHGKDYIKAFKDANIKTALALIHNEPVTYQNWLCKPLLPQEYTKHEIEHLPIKISSQTELSMQEMHTVADVIYKKTQEQKNIYIYGDLDSNIDQMGVLAYLIKYEKTALSEGISKLKALRPDLQLSDACLGRLYKFSLEIA